MLTQISKKTTELKASAKIKLLGYWVAYIWKTLGEAVKENAKDKH